MSSTIATKQLQRMYRTKSRKYRVRKNMKLQQLQYKEQCQRDEEKWKVERMEREVKRKEEEAKQKEDDKKEREAYIASHPELCSTPKALTLIQEGAQHKSIVEVWKAKHLMTYRTEEEKCQCCPPEYEQQIRRMFGNATSGCKFYNGQHDARFTCALCSQSRHNQDMASSARLYHSCQHNLSFTYTEMSGNRYGGGFMESDNNVLNLFRPQSQDDRECWVCLDCVKVFPFKVLEAMKQNKSLPKEGEDKHWIDVPKFDRESHEEWEARWNAEYDAKQKKTEPETDDDVCV